MGGGKNLKKKGVLSESCREATGGRGGESGPPGIFRNPLHLKNLEPEVKGLSTPAKRRRNLMTIRSSSNRQGLENKEEKNLHHGGKLKTGKKGLGTLATSSNS